MIQDKEFWRPKSADKKSHAVDRDAGGAPEPREGGVGSSQSGQHRHRNETVPLTGLGRNACLLKEPGLDPGESGKLHGNRTVGEARGRAFSHL